MSIRLSLLLCLCISFSFGQGRLKSVLYDLDGLDIGATDLPDGDYANFDMDYQVAANPLSPSDVLGDRVLRLDLNWSSGTGEFGKGISRYIELDPASDRINFYFYNPLSNYASAVADVVIREDDNGSFAYESSADDKWSRTVTITRSASWQLISLPLSSFIDVNTGGNGVFDATYTGDKGMVLVVGILFHKSSAAVGPEHYFLDMWSFSEGTLPYGSDILSLPYDYAVNACELGSLAYRSPADSVPPEMENMLGPGNQLRYVNIFMPYSYTGTTAVNIPGTSVQNLLNNGYRPMITWEAMYSSYAPLDPVQPELNDIIAGTFDSYIDLFATKIKSYNDTIILRLFHEFDGNWYPWAVTNNGNDPSRLIAAFRHIVDRFNAIGATKVLWCWSPNSSPTPSRAYNWNVLAYPGSAYVDIVSISVYNHPIPGTPPWRSFRSIAAESHYYLTKYFPGKQFFISELASRERYSSENPGSQSKDEWLCQMSKDLRSYFSRTRAIIFFQTIKDHDWRINSSTASLNAVRSCIWQNSYFGYLTTEIDDLEVSQGISVWPNPFGEVLYCRSDNAEPLRVTIMDAKGSVIRTCECLTELDVDDLKPGMYIFLLSSEQQTVRRKLIRY